MTKTAPPAAGTDTSDPWWEPVVTTLSQLIQIDTQIGGHGERAAAEWVAEFLADVGISSELVEAEPGRTSVVARVPGADPSLDPLLVQMHLDVVPANPDEWSVHPLSGEVRDGYVWGRGAVDMKNMVASVLTIVHERLRAGRLPRRPLVLAFFADEENAGVLGAEWVVRNRPDLFDGCRVAIGEGGGYSVTLPHGQHLYPVHVAEKGWAAVEVSAAAAPSHASRIFDANPVRVVAEAVGRLTHEQFPVHLSAQVEQLLRDASAACGREFDPERPQDAAALLGTDAGYALSALRNTAHVTLFTAGYQSNVVPGAAVAQLDCRFLPGQWDQFWQELRSVTGDHVRLAEVSRTPGLSPADPAQQARVFTAALQAIRAEDPGARISPSLMSGGTDATHLQQLGIQCFGFNPLMLPADLDYWALFHGIDERVPIDGLHFCTRTLDRFLDIY